MSPLALSLLLLPSLLGGQARSSVTLSKQREAELGIISGLAINRKGTELAVCIGRDVVLLDSTTLKTMRTYRAAGSRAAFALGDRALVVSGVFRTGIELLDLKSGDAEVVNYGEPDFRCNGAGTLVAYRTEGKAGPAVVLFDLGTKKAVRRWEPKEALATLVHGFAHKGHLLATCTRPGMKAGKPVILDVVHVWASPLEGKPATVELDAAPRCLAVSPDGKFLAVGTDENEILVWNLTHSTRLHTLSPHHQTGQVAALAFSPDGRYLASMSSRTANRRISQRDTGAAELVLLDTQKYQTLCRVQAHQAPCREIAFFPDSKRLVTGSRWEKWVRIWEIRPARTER